MTAIAKPESEENSIAMVLGRIRIGGINGIGGSSVIQCRSDALMVNSESRAQFGKKTSAPAKNRSYRCGLFL